MSQNVQFRLNNHVTRLFESFNELRNKEVHCDTTLITEEGFVCKVHGAVMIATSRYFEEVLANVTPEQHPIIVLKDIKFTELSCLLDYIYQGVTQVDQHLVKSVLEAADNLEIKGLSNMKNNISMKKLIASCPSAAQSINSPDCFPHSKSPSPSPPLRTHSQSCYSPSSDAYPQSFTLKPDTKEVNVEMECSNLSYRHNYSDKAIGSEQPLDAVDISTNSIFPTRSEYLKHKLGFDLRLSRVSCEGNGNIAGKIDSHEETHVRKRKFMSEDLIRTKKKIDLSLSDTDDVDCDYFIHNQEEDESLKFRSYMSKKGSCWDVKIEENPDRNFNPRHISESESLTNHELSDFSQKDTNCYRRDATIRNLSEQSELCQSSSDETRHSIEQDPLFIPDIFEASSSSMRSVYVKNLTVNSFSVTDFVDVNIHHSTKSESKTAVITTQTKDAFGNIDQRIRRPMTKSEDLIRTKKKVDLSLSDTDDVDCDYFIHNQEENESLKFRSDMSKKGSCWDVKIEENPDRNFNPRHISESKSLTNYELSDFSQKDTNCYRRDATIRNLSEQSELCESSSDETRHSIEQDPLFIPDIFEASSSSMRSVYVKNLTVNSFSVTDFVDVNIHHSTKSESKTAVITTQTKDAFGNIDQRIRRPMTKSEDLIRTKKKIDLSLSDFVDVNIHHSTKSESKTAVITTQTKDAFGNIDQRIRRPMTKVKRPLSKYTLYMKETHPIVAQEHPGKNSREILKIASARWSSLPPEEKKKWEDKANDLLKDFKVRNPNYVYCSIKLQEEKSEYHRKKMEKKNMFKINPFITKL